MNTSKPVYFILPLITLVLLACSVGNVTLSRTIVQGSGKVATEERDVSDVERVSLSGMGNLEIIQGDVEGLTVEADDNVLRYIETRMNGRELEIDTQDGIDIKTSTPIRYTLRVKSLSRVAVSGAGNISAASLDTGDLEVTVSGSGNVDIERLQAEDLRVHISGSGNFTLAGKAATQDVTISGSGKYNAGDLSSQQVEITVSGSGDLTVWAIETLDIQISGHGNVSYYGRPAATQSISGSGTVKSLGEHP